MNAERSKASMALPNPQKAPREALTVLVERLRDPTIVGLLGEVEPLPPTAIPPSLAVWLADGIKDFLDGHAKSLDAALGLTNPRGRPKDLANRERMARAIWDECPRRPNFDQPGRLNSDQGPEAVASTAAFA